MLKFMIFVVIAVALAVEADYAPRPTKPQHTPCKESLVSGHLRRTVPTRQSFELEFGLRGFSHTGTANISLIIDDSQSQGEEPKNLIVLDAQADLRIKGIAGLHDSTGKYLLETCCRDYENNLLVITLNQDVEDQTEIVVSVPFEGHIREDGKGLHRENDGWSIKADFSGKQANSIVPCIDDEHDSIIGMQLNLKQAVEVTSAVTKVTASGSSYKFDDTEPMKLSAFSFEAHIEN